MTGQGKKIEISDSEDHATTSYLSRYLIAMYIIKWPRDQWDTSTFAHQAMQSTQKWLSRFSSIFFH
jgi:hypothetical protein